LLSQNQNNFNQTIAGKIPVPFRARECSRQNEMRHKNFQKFSVRLNPLDKAAEKGARLKP